jgi:hypothetical protein
MISHPEAEEILQRVLILRQKGLAIPKITHELARQYKAPSYYSQVKRVVGWESDHVIDCIKELRKRGLLEPGGIKKYLVVK